MALGSVTVNNQNLGQGSFDAIERTALFIGAGSDSTLNQLLSLNAQSDLDQLLGEADSDLKTQLAAAQSNGGQNWQAWALPVAVDAKPDVLAEALDVALQRVTPELAVMCLPAAQPAEITAAFDKLELVRTMQGRRLIGLLATPGIDAEAQTWSDYIAAQEAIVGAVSAYRVAVVPQLHGNNLGVLAGRLCNRAASIADSPMRVATGPLLSLGETPQDKENQPFDNATAFSLDALRLSVPQTYPDYPGTYWADCNLLDADGGDYQVIENLRVVDKAARAVRNLAIARIADRSLNSTPASVAAHKTYFARPLRQMSRSVTIGGIAFPAEIQPPEDGAIELQWPTRDQVAVYIKVTPFNAAKAIVANIALDLRVDD